MSCTCTLCNKHKMAGDPVLSRLSCPGFPVQAVQSRLSLLSFVGLHAVAFIFCLHVSAVLSRLSSRSCLAVIIWHACPCVSALVVFYQLSCPACPTLAVRIWLSWLSRLSCLGYVGFPVMTVRSRMYCNGNSVLTVLPQPSCPAALQ
jgi:hypothetical protein